MASLKTNVVILARCAVALPFLAVGAAMITEYTTVQAFMVATGLPGALLPWLVAVVIAGALSLISGYWLHWAALAMALVAVTAAVLLPDGFADYASNAALFRSIAIASVLLLIPALVADCWSRGRHAFRAVLRRRSNTNCQPTGVIKHA